MVREETAAFYAAVYQAVQEIPYGRVTTYSHIADLVGRRKCLREQEARRRLTSAGSRRAVGRS